MYRITRAHSIVRAVQIITESEFKNDECYVKGEGYKTVSNRKCILNSLKLVGECLDLHSRQNGLSHFILCRDDLAFQPLCFWYLESVIPPEAGILLLLFLDMLSTPPNPPPQQPWNTFQAIGNCVTHVFPIPLPGSISPQL